MKLYLNQMWNVTTIRSRLERSQRKRKVGCSNPSRDRPGSGNSTVKRSEIGVSVKGPRGWPV